MVQYETFGGEFSDKKKKKKLYDEIYNEHT